MVHTVRSTRDTM